MKHGASAYANGKCKCEVCTEANRLKEASGRSNRKWRLENGFDGPKEHGPSGYCNWGCRCEVCKDGHRIRCKEQALARLEKMKAGSPEVPHGTRSGYTAWGCRCDECFAVSHPLGRQRARRRVIED